MTPYLSLIVPAYNEETRITASLLSMYAYLQKQQFSWEMLIVIDGATDNTLEKVTAFAAGKPQVRWIDRKENRGKGYTVREGMLAANGKIRLFSDADNSTDMTHFDRMLPLFENDANVVICSRDPKDAHGAGQAVPQSFFKRLLGNMGNLFIQLMAVPGIWDTQCGFKAFTAQAAEAIFPLARIDGWGSDIEFLALARRLGYRINVVPAHWIDQAGTHVKFLDYFGTFGEAMRVRWNLMSGVYNQPLPVAEVEKGR